jgi:hypothetical protein
MPYPREIYLDPETETRLISYLDDELYMHYGERGQWLDDIIQHQKDYWAKPTREKATFPYSGAATIIIPLTAIAVEAVHARVMTTLFSLPQLVSATAIDPKWADAVRPVERAIDKELKLMKFRDVLDSSLLECEKFGNGIGKVGYERMVRTAIRTNADGEDEEFEVVIREGPNICATPLSRFLLPFYSQDPQTSPWVGEEHSRTPYEILQMENSGFFRPGTFAKLENWIQMEGESGKFEKSQEQLEKTQQGWPSKIDWKEIWLTFNVDGNDNGKQHEIVVHYHQEAQLVMSVRYNWNSDLRRPYRLAKYFPVEHRWRALGICKKNEQFQREVTTQHRQRLDNATLANMRMFKVHKNSGYGPKEPIFPGKMWFLDDMTHIDSIQLGEIYPSAYNNEQATLMFSQQRTGVNETILGMPQAGTPGTATSDLARIQEGNKKFDYIYQNIGSFVNELITDSACAIQQFGPRNIEYFNRAEGGNLVRQFFALPESSIRDGLVLEFSRAGQQKNDILDRQNWTQIAGLLTQYFTGVLQLSQLSGDQNITQLIARKGITSATEAMQQILESFNIRNIDRVILKELLTGAANGGLNSTGSSSGGIGGPQQIGSLPRMGNSNQIISPFTSSNEIGGSQL